MSDFIETYMGIRFSPISPETKYVCVEDIAHALSLVTRAGGHIKTFFSVAQHSLNCEAEAEARGFSPCVRLACLLHDGSEAYIADVTRPVKRFMTEYRAVEERMQQVVYEALGVGSLTEQEQRQIAQVDDAMLYYEFEHFGHSPVFPEPPPIKSCPDFSLRPFAEVEAEFLARYEALSGRKRTE